jgi:hypothetical protein
VAMKHIKEPPPPLPPDLPPNVRELIEIALVKNPGMRYRSGGPFADAVAAVRAGRRPPRPNQSGPAGRATPAAIPSGAQARAAANPTGRAPVARRARPTTGGHRTPPPRRTFSSGQRALLWAAGVLGALAIVIAILIVINSHDNNSQQQPSAPTVTDTGGPPSKPGSAPAHPTNWTNRGATGNPGGQCKLPTPRRAAALTLYCAVTPRHETPQ